MMLVHKGKRMLLLRKRMLIKHCWMLLLPKVMLLRHWQMLLLLRQMPHKLLLTPPQLKQMRTKHCWMPLPPLPLRAQQFPTLLTLPLETFLLEQGQVPTLLLRWGLMVKS
jgi:hypothetical protein